MSYKSIINGDDGAIDQLLNKKEYYSLKLPASDVEDMRHSADEHLFKGSMQLQSYQIFGKNFINPNTKNKRLLAKWQTGVGKSLFALAVANEFIKYYKLGDAVTSSTSQHHSPSIFIIGFSRALPRELLKFPEFGIISEEELVEMERLRRLAVAGTPADIKNAKDFRNRIKKRIHIKEQGGYYKEYGYQQFVYRLFNITDDVDIFKNKASTIDEKSLDDLIASGKIQVNMELLESMKGSLIICDEIHNVYNTEKKNNWGIAIQYVLDYHEKAGNAIYAVFMSATPINNSPSEIIDMLNLLLPPQKKLRKTDFFKEGRQLIPGKLEELGRLSKGVVSFIQDIDIRNYPERIIVGLEVSEPSIPYLKFLPCPLSRLHYETFKTVPECVIPTDGKSINSIVYPSPSSEIGLYRTEEIYAKIQYAPEEWKSRNQINIISKGGVRVISGGFLSANVIGKYSTKFKTLLGNVTHILKNHPGQKIMIYDDKVKTAGVIQIQELLLRNYIIDEHSEPAPDTLCSICGVANKDHKAMTKKDAEDPTSHKYQPVRFVIVHSDIDRDSRERAIDRFNSIENTYGKYYSILVGSKIIRESYDIKAICHMFIVTRPINIPTMLQIFGRAVRKGSHSATKYKFTKIYILLNTFDEDFWPHEEDPEYFFLGDDAAKSPYRPPENRISKKATEEMTRYSEKLSDFITIQQIEKQMHINAIDGTIHRELIMPPTLKKQLDADPNNLSSLYFEPNAPDKTFLLSDLDKSTYLAYGYAADEIAIISWITKILFIQQPAWTYQALWDAVRNYHYRVSMRTDVFEEENFKIVLSNLIQESFSTTQIHSTFNFNDKFIVRPGTDILYKVVPLVDGVEGTNSNILYVLFPTDASGPIVDLEPYNINDVKSHKMELAVDRLVLDVEFKDYRKEFEATYCDLVGTNKLSLFLGDYSLAFHVSFMMYLIEAAIGGTLKKNIYKECLRLYVECRLILAVGDLMEVSIRNAWDEPLDGGTPIGFIHKKTIRIFTKFGWKDISLTNIKYVKGVTDLVENEKVVGFMDNENFKMRGAAKEYKDSRFIERGIVCITKKKETLEDLLAELESLSGVSSGLGKGNASRKMKTLCNGIKFQLIQLQMQSYRDKKGIRYFYFYNELM